MVRTDHLNDSVAAQFIWLAYTRFRTRVGLQDSPESALLFADHWTDAGVSAFLGRTRDEIVKMLDAKSVFAPAQRKSGNHIPVRISSAASSAANSEPLTSSDLAADRIRPSPCETENACTASSEETAVRRR